MLRFIIGALCTIGVIYLSYAADQKPPKFDALPLITTYDKESMAVVPSSWQGKSCTTPEEISALLPATLAYYCIKYPNYDTPQEFLRRMNIFLQGTKIPKKELMLPVKYMCNAGLIDLSPQTRFNVKRAFLNIIHGIVIDVQDPRLEYHKIDEISRRHTIVNKLPTILKDLLLENCNNYNNAYEMHRILNPFYKTTLDGRQRYNYLSLSTIHDFILYHNTHHKSWWFEAISPQTAIRITTEYYGFKTLTEHPYNLREEINNFATLIAQFPQELKVTIADLELMTDEKELFPHKPVLQLTYIAYWLQDHSHNVLVNYRDRIPEYIIKIFKLKHHSKPNAADVNTLTEKFVKTFGPLNYCHDKLRESCLLPPLKAVIDHNAAIIRTQSSDAALKALSLDTITEKLKENLPTCPMCLDLFRNQFTKTQAGVRMTIVPCNHIFCDVCLEKPLITTCPLCRGKIESVKHC